MSKRVADVLVETLQAAGVKTCYGIVGDTMNQIAHSIDRSDGLYDANRNRAPIVLLATQIARQDLGFEAIQEIDYDDVFKGCSVYCEMILTAVVENIP